MRSIMIAILAAFVILPVGAEESLQQDVYSAIWKDRIRGVQKGKPAPDFQLTAMDGSNLRLSDFRGKIVVLNFWATWCPPCKEEMPHIEKLYVELKDKDFELLAVNMTHTEKSNASVKQFVEMYGLTFPVLLDSHGIAAHTYQIIYYPTTIVVDKNGTVDEIIYGAVSYDVLQRAVTRLLQ